MKETVIVIGSGIVARSLSATLSWLGDEVVNIDCNIQESLNRLPGILRLGKVSCVYHLEDGTKQDSLDAFYYVCDNCKMRGVKLVYASAPVESGLNVAERYAKFYNREATGVRLFNVYGPNPCQGTLLHSLLYGECVKLEHNGEDIRCFTFIDNAVEGLIYASASGDAILNCVNDEPMSVLDFCREVQELQIDRGEKPVKLQQLSQAGESTIETIDRNFPVIDIPYTTVKEGLKKLYIS